MASAWHTWWQDQFDDREVVHPKLPECAKERRADAVAFGGRVVVEFQHSHISRDEVDARSSDYGHHGKRVVWVVDGNAGVGVKRLALAQTYLLAFGLDAHWKYASFTTSGDPIYLHCGEQVYRVAPGEVRSHMIDVHSGRPVDAFVGAVERSGTADALWEHCAPLPQCTLYLNQRGAGCGKTYESIQLLTNDPRVAHKSTFVYLTKAHTAKTVIRDELVQQLDAGKLASVSESDEVVDVGKQYRGTFTRSTDGTEITVLIGTIDSFMWRLGDRDAAAAKGGDVFRNLCESIKAGFVGHHPASGGFRYASGIHFLNKECLVVVDEAQDLDPAYLEALAAIMRNTYIDVYVIGDKLQSIWGADNVFTCLEESSLPHVVLKKSVGANVVRRFHDAKLMDFVNSCVEFERYELSKIVGVCDGVGCGHAHDEAHEAVVRIAQPRITMRTKESTVYGFVEHIVSRVHGEVQRHGYMPHNFMFVFPVMKCNVLAARLETRLNDFWIGRFGDEAYRQEVLARHPYWRERIGGDDGCGDGFYIHAVMHKADESKPINLDESRYSTRLLSIHAAKGQGCDVVFLLGMTEDTLKLFSKGSIDLVYESLLHVAVTRSKRTLYVGVQTDAKDDIYARFTVGGTHDVEPTVMSLPNDSFNVSKLVDFVTTQSAWYDRMNAEYFAPRGLDEAVPVPEGGASDLLDWGHHVVRWHVMFYALLHEIGRMGSDAAVTKQVWAVMQDIAGCPVVVMGNARYYAMLREFNCIEPEDRPSVIPVLEYQAGGAHDTQYGRYRDALVRIITRVQDKIKAALARGRAVPELCPIEMCAFVHVMRVRQDGVYHDFSATELYGILHSVAQGRDTRHGGFGCACDVELCDGGNGGTVDNERLRTSIANHRLTTARVASLFAMFEQHLRAGMGDSTRITFNVSHNITFNGHTNFFKMYNPSVPFVATTDHNVVLFALHPSFTRMQRDVVFASALLNTFLARNSGPDTNNRARFDGKRVSVCVISFSSAAPVWIHLDGGDAAWDDTPIRECIAAFLCQTFRKANAVLWTRFDGFLRGCPEGRFSPAFQLMDRALKESDRVPKYVDAYFDAAKHRSKEERRCTVQGVGDMDAALDQRIHEWLFDDDTDW